uniref:Putative 1-acyl-sn-glycerol-3-phosphate acyltransferase 4 (Trinotate prediction) n=1 Tax=Myxobolus squamalis TaxID=59785 RepID=A0A6B2G661_MYXSQ
MKNNFDEVLDLTVCYSGISELRDCIPKCSIFDAIWNDNIEVHIHVKRWKISELMLLDSDCSYLYDWYFEKDKRIHEFYTVNGNKFNDHKESIHISFFKYFITGFTIPFTALFILYIFGCKIIFTCIFLLSIICYCLQITELVF